MSTITYKKVSDLLEAQSLNLTDYIPIVSDGANYKITVETLANAIGGGGSGIEFVSGKITYDADIKTMATLTFITGQIGE